MAKIKKDLDASIRHAAKDRCGYCLNPQELMPYKLEIEHLSQNLWFVCREFKTHEP